MKGREGYSIYRKGGKDIACIKREGRIQNLSKCREGYSFYRKGGKDKASIEMEGRIEHL